MVAERGLHIGVKRFNFINNPKNHVCQSLFPKHSFTEYQTDKTFTLIKPMCNLIKDQYVYTNKVDNGNNDWMCTKDPKQNNLQIKYHVVFLGFTASIQLCNIRGKQQGAHQKFYCIS